MRLINNLAILNHLKKYKNAYSFSLLFIILLLFFVILSRHSQNSLKCIIISFLFLIFCILIYLKETMIRYNNKLKIDYYRKELIKTNNLHEKTMNKMKNKYLKQISKSQKDAQFGQICGELFHEIANPITSLNLNIERFKKHITKTPELKKFNEDLENTTKIAKKIAEMISVIKKQQSTNTKKKNFSINQEIEGIITMLKFKSYQKRIMLNFYADDEIYIYGSSANFFRACLNIICNAIDAYSNFNPWLIDNKAGCRIVEISIKKHMDKIVVIIKDYGKGIKKKNIDKIFDPFFSTKKPEKGTGVGLHFSLRIIENEFNGKILVFSEAGKGSLFKIII